ncbi:haloacid dehalogenase-like hydrolase domain-containing 2 [Micractinium conductrix]|uniref:Haloacid dehalogenase-like hydrolase domain-containing protein 2 n=1 Tax=Micractinium conductrix TaxID=554055 RepID=A0A2P6V5J1_9CHLO|nr:haloacid dehalogenase-like hydrolase domain-containing 2 [Micractinium conductrix]|eukprot:PSC69360.1 haloacid dehalogenase-like hydrolase domain-containing 2 [Micractinium conductrix]
MAGSGGGGGGGDVDVDGTAPQRIRGALIDLNGTLHVGDTATPGSQAALRRLRDAGVACRFVTNTTKDTISNLLALVQGLGFDISNQEVFSSLTATRRLLEARQLRPFMLLHPKALPDFEGLPTHEPNCVVVGLAKEAFTYENLNAAARILLNDPDAPLIAIHKGRLFKEPDGLSLGPGPFVVALEYATGRVAQVVGKPEASFFQLALSDLGCSPGDAVMIGDDARDDVGGAQGAGLRGLVVQTGKFRPGDEAATGGAPPAATVRDFAAAVDWILAQNAAAGGVGGG